MKKFLTGLLIGIVFFQVFYSCASVIAETLSDEVVDTETAAIDSNEPEMPIGDLSKEGKQVEEIVPLANAEVIAHFTNFFNRFGQWPQFRIGNPQFLWQEMFENQRVTSNGKANVLPKANAGITRTTGQINNNYREFPYAWDTESTGMYRILSGEMNALYNPHVASHSQTVIGTNKTNDIRAELTFSSSGLTAQFTRLRDFDYQNQSSPIFNFQNIESYMYLWRYWYPYVVGIPIEGRNLHITGKSANVELDLSRFFQVKTQEPVILTLGTEHFQNESLDISKNFHSGTGFYGERLFHTDVKLIQENVDWTKPGRYTAQFDYYGYRVDFPVTVKEDKSTLNVRNSQIYKGDTWRPQDNFISATEKNGSNIPYSTTRIRTSGTVDTNTPGTYTIHYNSYDASGNILQTQRAVVTVSEDKSELVVKDSQITAGSNWSPQDNFVSASTKTGINISYSTTRIQTSGTVNTNVAGTYPIVYTSHEANGDLLRTETANVTVIPASVQVNHIDSATGNTFGSKELTGVIGGGFRASPEKNDNYKYRYATVNGTNTEEQEIIGTFTEEKQTVNFYYNSRGGNITVMHLEEGSNKILGDTAVLEGYIDDSYSIDLKEPQHVFEGYVYSRVNGSLTGSFNANGQVITLYYTREMPKISTIDFSFGQLNKMTTLAYAEKTQDKMTITLPKVLENETESSWRLSAMLERPFKAGTHEITSQLSLADLQFSGSSGSQILNGNNWQLEPGVAVPLVQLTDSKQEERKWSVQFGEESQNKMSGVALRLSATEVKDNIEYSSTVHWTLTNEP
ncbi:bacterial group 3 Ig-like protein [Enterococcus faecalis 13-SD-W-01]|nr:bacterial group 3 Ig-like protein [Enterococcus faecalis 13-SD-W-01]